MKTIELTQGLVALVNDEDFEKVNKFSWFAFRSHRTFYAARQVRVSPTKQRMLCMHTMLFGCLNVDHINGNGLDNRRDNLRLSNSSKQKANSRVPLNNKSGFKGVFWVTRDKCWRAQIGVNYRRIHIGDFGTKESAARAYDSAAKKYFGDFARLNFPVTIPA